VQLSLITGFPYFRPGKQTRPLLVKVA